MIDRLLTRFEQLVITVGFAVATLVLFTNVVLRYAFDTGLVWALELVEYLFAWVVLIGAAHGIKAGIHLGIDLFTRRFPPRVQRYLGLLSVLLCLAFAVPVLGLSIEYTYKVWEWGDLTLDLQIPQWIPYLAIPTGMGLMVYRLVQVAVAIWRGERLHVGRTEHDAMQAREPREVEE